MDDANLELGFYLPDVDPTKSVVLVSESLRSLAGSLRSASVQRRFERGKGSASIAAPVPLSFGTDGPVSEISMHGCTGIGKDEQIVTLGAAGRRVPFGINEAGDIATVHILFDGAPFGGDEVRALSAGRRMSRLFLRLVETIRPAYASISFGAHLQTPREIPTLGDTQSFQNCFVGNHLVRDRDAFVQSLGQSPTVVQVDTGILVWCSRRFGAAQDLNIAQRADISRTVSLVVSRGPSRPG